MITPRHQHIQLVKPLMPAENEGPRRRARPRDMSAARPLTSVCHAGVWGGVSTAHPRPDGTKRGTRREQRGQGNARGGWVKRRGEVEGGAADATDAADTAGERGEGERQ